MRWFCSQIGAREHYALPRALAVRGKLERLYTDIWCLPDSLASRFSGALAGRYQAELATANIVSRNYAAMRRMIAGKLRNDRYSQYVCYGRWYSEIVRDHLKNSGDVHEKMIFLSYDTSFLETAEYVKEEGGNTLVCQIDPAEYEYEIVQAEREKWQGWMETQKIPQEYLERRRSEWTIADRILVNSEWTKQALIKQNVEAAKLHIVPLCYEPEQRRTEELFRTERRAAGPLRVLWLGSVNLRKGIQYLLQAANLLKTENIRFDIVGRVEINMRAVGTLPKTVKFHGACHRSQAKDWYHKADVFVLPTLSDGFAITQLEAMSYGLPVIATERCGAVVSDGIDGWIIPAGDGGKLAETLAYCATHRKALEEFSFAAQKKSKLFSLSRLQNDLERLEKDFHER